jgi:RNA-directed DNA polymerase
MIVEKMAQDLGVTTAYIESLAKSASHHYKWYLVKKRSGGTRDIYHPSKRLKALQRWIAEYVIALLPVHESASAYRKGRSVLDNAKVHAPSKYLLRMDLTKFFPSISRIDIRNYITQNPTLFTGWSSSDMEIFCLLACRNSELTIGAPTSPGLSNVLCYDLDVKLFALCGKSHVKYTRYADDMFFSSDRPNILREIEAEVKKIIAELPIPAGLTVNLGKTRHSSKRGARRVTGIVLGSDGCAYIGRALKRKIRALICQFGSLNEGQRASLAGLIAYASGFDPDFKNQLIAKYGLDAVRRATATTLKGRTTAAAAS